MFYLQRRLPLVRERAAKAELKIYGGYGAATYQRGRSHYFDLLIPLDQRKPERQAAWFERVFPNVFMLVKVHNFDVDGGVVSEPVAGAVASAPEPEHAGV